MDFATGVGAGALVLMGYEPTLQGVAVDIPVPAGELILTGYPPTAVITIFVPDRTDIRGVLIANASFASGVQMEAVSVARHGKLT